MSNQRQGRITLATGRYITMDALTQWAIYDGILNGVPFKRINDAEIAHARERAQQEHAGRVPYLIEPERRDYHTRPGDMVGQTHSWGAPEFLPEIACIANFWSSEPTRGSTHDCSLLTVIWFQHAYAFPIETSVLEKLCSLDWDGLATDGDW